MGLRRSQRRGFLSFTETQHYIQSSFFENIYLEILINRKPEPSGRTAYPPGRYQPWYNV